MDLSPNTQIKLVIWDVAGTDAITTIERNYLQGATGLILVADGTRENTLPTALDLAEQAYQVIGRKPALLLINKYDLIDQWQLPTDIPTADYPSFCCSALNGHGVAQAFHRLAGMLVE